MFYDEEIVKALRRKFAPDIMTALRDATGIELISPKNSVNVPVVAGVTVFHEKGLAAFIVRAEIRDRDKERWLGGEQLFSTRELKSARDKAEYISYCFDQAKAQLIRALVDGELKEILKEDAA
jgi:hypothetical protein